MCGIYGFYGNKINLEYIKILALYNETRGGDASGFYSDKHGIIKDSLTVSDFLMKNLHLLNCYKMLIGHSRFATHGKNTKNNAHPFKFGSITGVHNGVLHNFQEIASKYTEKQIKVDSKCIFISLNYEQEKTILPEIIGSMAIAYTKNDGKLYLFRRDNPLYVGSNQNGIYFSSIYDSLYICNLSNIHQIDENVIYTYNNNKLANKIKIKEPDYYKDELHYYQYSANELIDEFGFDRVEAKYIASLPPDEQECYLYE